MWADPTLLALYLHQCCGETLWHCLLPQLVSAVPAHLNLPLCAPELGSGLLVVHFSRDFDTLVCSRTCRTAVQLQFGTDESQQTHGFQMPQRPSCADNLWLKVTAIFVPCRHLTLSASPSAPSISSVWTAGIVGSRLQCSQHISFTMIFASAASGLQAQTYFLLISHCFLARAWQRTEASWPLVLPLFHYYASV